MKLYYSENLNPRLCVAASRYLEAPVEYVRASPFDPAQAAFFLAMNPNQLIPILQDGDTVLWETDAIVCHLSRVVGSAFFPDGRELPELIKWLSWAAYDFGKHGQTIYFDRITVPKYNFEHLEPKRMEQHHRDFHRGARVLDEILADRQWLVGDRVTYADFRVCTVLPFVDEMRIDLSPYPNITRLNKQLEAIPAWRSPLDGLA